MAEESSVVKSRVKPVACKRISIVIVTYNSARYISACIGSITTQQYPGGTPEIIVIDNDSRDDTVHIIRERYPHVTLIANNTNAGWGRANNQGIKNAHGDYVVVLNPDTCVEGGWLEPLIAPLINKPYLLTTPKILIYDGSVIGNCGNLLHFTGLAFTRGYGAPRDACQLAGSVGYVSGCCFATRRDTFTALGGFDEDLFLYHDDLDFTCKAYLAGFESCYVPTSVIRHDYTLTVPPEKLALLEQGRYIFLRKHLTERDFVRFLPSLIMTELLSWGFATKLGAPGIAAKLQALRAGVAGSVNRRHGDRSNLFRHLSKTIPEDQLTSTRIERAFVRIANWVFRLNAPS